MSKRYTENEFIAAVRDSRSIRQVLQRLGLVEAGGNYQSAKNLIKKLGLSTQHMTGQGSNKGKWFGPKRPIEDYLSNKQSITSHSLKLRLIKERLLEKHCYHCALTEWLSKPIPLELHHIDGNHANNNLSNLSLLCPNCHALTDNYRGKNRDRGT